jgi:hypothetical protein
MKGGNRMLRSITDPSNNHHHNESSMAPVVLLAGLATAFIIKKTMQGTKKGPAQYEKRANHDEEGNDEESTDLVL